MGLLAFMGLFTNLAIIFYTNNNFIPLEGYWKLFYIVLTENIVVLLMQIISYDGKPYWYDFKGNIEIKYLKKYGVRLKNKTMNLLNKIHKGS